MFFIVLKKAAPVNSCELFGGTALEMMLDLAGSHSQLASDSGTFHCHVKD